MAAEAEGSWITQIDFARFEAAFRSPDAVGAVVRCHFEMERAALRALTRIVPKYELMRHRYLSDHLKTFRAMGTHGPIFQVADYVNKVSNEFAHDGIDEITVQHVDELFSQAASGFGRRHIRDWVIGAGVYGIAEDTRFADLPNSQAFVAVAALAAASIDTIPQRLPKIIHLDHL